MRGRAAVLLLGCLAAGCTEDAPPPPSPSATPPPVAESPLTTGSLEGIIRVDSDDIGPVKGSVRGYEKYCGTGPLDLGLYRVDPSTRGLADAFVEADGRCSEVPAGEVPVLDQKNCVFDPPMRVVPPGPMVFKNSDGMAHNVTIRGLLNPHVMEGFPGGNSISRTLPFDERLTVRCSIHPWMVAGLVVTRRAAHALSDAQGRFRIEKVEAGRRTIKVWHVLGDEVTLDVDVQAGETTRVDIPWKPRPNFRAGFQR